MSTTVRQILARKPAVYSVTPGTTVFDALRAMAEHNIGALLVLENDQVVGIFSERDYARKVILHGKSSKDLTVREIMTSPVVCADPAWSAYDCMVMMTQWRVRHLPVLERERLIGVISIGDVVSAVVSEQATTIRNLEHYIASGS
jgi:CBS domain-containing protein